MSTAPFPSTPPRQVDIVWHVPRPYAERIATNSRRHDRRPARNDDPPAVLARQHPQRRQIMTLIRNHDPNLGVPRTIVVAGDDPAIVDNTNAGVEVGTGSSALAGSVGPVWPDSDRGAWQARS